MTGYGTSNYNYYGYTDFGYTGFGEYSSYTSGSSYYDYGYLSSSTTPLWYDSAMYGGYDTGFAYDWGGGYDSGGFE
jgi:hypothetical protein